jgi:hypothetical protein
MTGYCRDCGDRWCEGCGPKSAPCPDCDGTGWMNRSMGMVCSRCPRGQERDEERQHANLESERLSRIGGAG